MGNFCRFISVCCNLYKVQLRKKAYGLIKLNRIVMSTCYFIYLLIISVFLLDKWAMSEKNRKKVKRRL